MTNQFMQLGPNYLAQHTLSIKLNISTRYKKNLNAFISRKPEGTLGLKNSFQSPNSTFMKFLPRINRNTHKNNIYNK